jgi:beta-aspartyl-dipeptidase (metallo-type)
MLMLLRGGEVYAPDPLGRVDVLVAGERILAVGAGVSVQARGCDVQIVECAGRLVCPGFIDWHNHILGGGGGNGFASRVPPIRLSQLTRAGITTVVGMLGFDRTTRNMEALLGLARGLDEEGITTFLLSGATTEHPVPTLTGSIRQDLLYVDKVIGVGELSISELGPAHETFGPGPEYVARVAAEAMMAARLAGKAGITCLQVPTNRRALAPVFEILEKTGLPPALFIPSSSNSDAQYLEQAIRLAKLGSVVDITASYTPLAAHPKAIKPSAAIRRALEAGVPIEHVTMETDGNGGYPAAPGVTHYLSPDTLHAEFRAAVLEEKVPLADALRVVGSNQARVLKLAHRKGTIAPGADADFVLMTPDLAIDRVFARGRLMVDGGQPVVRGKWEALLAS